MYVIYNIKLYVVFYYSLKKYRGVHNCTLCILDFEIDEYNESRDLSILEYTEIVFVVFCFVFFL